MEMSWDKNWLSVDEKDGNAVEEKLSCNGLYTDDHYRTYSPSWNSIVTGKPHRYSGRRVFLFLGDETAIMAKLIL